MICVFDKNADDFTTNGLAPLAPYKCEITETLNGEYRLEMKHPYDEYGKWKYLQPGNIIKASVPRMNTPQLNMLQSTTGASVYVCTAGERVRMHTGPGIHNGPCVDYIEDGEEIIVPKEDFVYVENDDYYARATSPRGITGYVRIQLHFRLVRDLPADEAEEEIREIIPARKIRDQPFRIYRVVHNLKEIMVYAKHIFYDLQDNMILNYAPEAALEGKAVAKGILSNTVASHGFTPYSDITSTAADVRFENVNPAEALLNEDNGFCAKYHAEMLRDWFDVYLVAKIGEKSNVVIVDGKNLQSITYDADITDMANRIIPIGKDADGNSLYLPETYVESPDMAEDDLPKYLTLNISEAKIGDGMTQEQAYEKMREAANKEFEGGTDAPIETVTVDYIDMTGIDEYQSIGLTDNIFLGDLVRVQAQRIGKEFTKRMTQYTFDCLTERYTSITLGTPYDIN